MYTFYRCFKNALLGLMMLLTATAWAQESTVTGKVNSSDDNSTMPGVNILEKGTTNGTTTDSDGKFSLQVKQGATLVFSFVGYVTQEVAVNNQTVLDVNLEPDATALSEVVVVGYGTVQKKDLTGAVSQVSSRDFNAGVNPNPLQAIQGKVAGLTITQPSGDPNQAPTVRLRGYTSLAGGSDPLYVVDGVIGVPINSISPSDIDRVDVLKDASAAAIYGSRGANGVIMITTKRGKDGKSTLTFNNYIGMETISKQLDLMNASEYRAQVERIKGPASLDDGLKFPKDANGNGYDTDWMKEITRTGFTNNHEIALSGGTPSLSYRGSLNYIKREGIIKNTGFERVTGRINLDQKALNDRLSIQYNLAITNSVSDNTFGDIINRAVLFLPTLPVHNEDGSYYEVPGSFDLYNPVAMQENYQNQDQTRTLIGAVNAKYEVIDNLTLGVNGAYKNTNTINGQAYNVEVNAYKGMLGAASRSLNQLDDKLLELTAQYRKEFNMSTNLTVLGGYSFQEVINDGFGAKNNIGDPSFADLGLYHLYGYNNLGRYLGTLFRGQNDYATSFKNSYKLISFFGRATFNMKDKYNVTATLRRDGSSKFGVNNKWGMFPSVAVGWTLSNESFLSDNTTLNYLKLRAGWGQTGNSEGIKAYGSQLLYGPAPQNYYDPILHDYVAGVAVIQNANPDLRWEILSQVNIGLDFELFSGKINGTLEVYNKQTKDMLYNYSISATGNTVAPNILANVGKMSNKGIELTLGSDVIDQGNFRWNVKLLTAYYKNEVVLLSTADYSPAAVRFNAFNGRGLGLIYSSEMQEGRPLGEFLVPHFRGYDENGLILLETEDGGTTTDYASAKKFGNGTGLPRFTASLINSFNYGKFDLSFQLRGVFGNKIINNLRSNLALPGSILENNMIRDVADFPAAYSTPQLSDLWVESGSFVRLDNWQLGYTFPATGVLQNARIYLGGNNLFIITKYKGLDPELEVKGDLDTNSSSPNSIGMDYSNVYPKTRSFVLGVNLTF